MKFYEYLKRWYCYHRTEIEEGQSLLSRCEAPTIYQGLGELIPSNRNKKKATHTVEMLIKL
jgi:hypothetical protein